MSSVRLVRMRSGGEPQRAGGPWCAATVRTVAEPDQQLWVTPFEPQQYSRGP